NEIVELPPLHRPQELSNDRVQHGPTPDQRLVTRIQETNRDYLQPVNPKRFDAILSNHLRRRIRPQHQRNIRTINVTIEEADLVSWSGKGDGKAHSYRGLPYSALARTNDNTRIYTGQRLRNGHLLTSVTMHMAKAST